MDARTRLTDMRAASRLAARDASLFAEPDIAADRLGWVGLPAAAAAQAGALGTLAEETRTSGITDVVLLGMGGSSLAPLVLSRVIGAAVGSPTLHVVDSTSPVQVQRLLDRLWPASTLAIVSSKSGTTVEPLSLAAIFRSWMDPLLGEDAGLHFVAITDPGSPLEEYAAQHGFATVFHAQPDVGGRYAALTPFGLVPAALTGIDVAALVERAVSMERACGTDGASPGVALAAWMADAYESGRDKLTLVCSERLAPFGLWVEQLVAESTGKQGGGLLPVLEVSPGDPDAYGTDRMVCVVREPDDSRLAALHTWLPSGMPHVEIVVSDPYEMGAEFVRWEWAVALFSALVGIEPFDQPNVAEAKASTQAILDETAAAPAPDIEADGGVRITTRVPGAPPAPEPGLASALEALLAASGQGTYLAVLAYLPEDELLLAPLRQACATVARARRLAVTFELGPRYLHSTGQYHKGGPATGRFLVITARDEVGPTVPGRRFTLAQLNRAQAEGDCLTLSAHGLPLVRVDLPASDAAAVGALAEALLVAATS